MLQTGQGSQKVLKDRLKHCVCTFTRFNDNKKKIKIIPALWFNALCKACEIAFVYKIQIQKIYTDEYVTHSPAIS